MFMKKYVLDTNVLITNPQSIFAFNAPNTEVIITQATLGELDHLKTKQEISREVRMVIRSLSNIVLGRTYDEIANEGIKLNEFCKTLPDTVKLRIIDYKGTEKFDINQQDARIIATTVQEGAVLVTRDVNMLLIALSSGCPAEQYTGDDVMKDSDVLFSGYIHVSKDFWENMGDDISTDKKGDYSISVQEFPIGTEFYPGTYVIMGDGTDGEIIGKIIDQKDSFVTMKPLNHKNKMKQKAWNVVPRDNLQAMAFDALFDSDNDVVSMVGGAGSGKSLLAIAAGLELVEKKKYASVIYVKADAGMGTDAHGYLPGDINEKLSQNILAARDALSYLCREDHNPESSIDYLVQKGIIQFPSMYYFRGRTLGTALPGQGSVIIIDEAQNLTVHEITSIISRAGENSKVVILGNIKQIDNRHVNALNNGMVYAVQKFREYQHSGHVILNTVYRSRLAAFVEDNF